MSFPYTTIILLFFFYEEKIEFDFTVLPFNGTENADLLELRVLI